MFFNNKVKNSFKMVKTDVSSLKQSTSEWVQYLEANQEEMAYRLLEMEARVRKLELENMRLRVKKEL